MTDLKKLAKVSLVVLVLIMSGLFAGCGSKDDGKKAGGEAKKDPIKIGALFPFTGNLAQLGEESFRGAELARKEINAKGGLQGREVVFIKGDAVDAKAAVAEAERLITNEKVDIIIGTYSSGLSYAASEVAERNSKIYWELGAVSDPITERGFKYLFRVCPRARNYGYIGSEFTAKAIAPALKKDPKDVKVGIVFEDGLYGTTVSQFAREKANQLGLKVVAYEAYNTKAVDLSSLIMKLKAAEPDVVLATSYMTDLLLYWRQSKELKFDCYAYVGMGGAASNDEFKQAVGDKGVEGALNVAFGDTALNRKLAPGLDDVLAAYKKEYGRDATSVYPVVNYVGAKVLFDVIAKAGNTKPDDIAKSALTIDIPIGGTAAGWGVKFADPGSKDAGQNIREQMVIVQWQNGKTQVVYPENLRMEGVTPKLPMPSWKERGN